MKLQYARMTTKDPSRAKLLEIIERGARKIIAVSQQNPVFFGADSSGVLHLIDFSPLFKTKDDFPKILTAAKSFVKEHGIVYCGFAIEGFQEKPENQILSIIIQDREKVDYYIYPIEKTEGGRVLADKEVHQNTDTIWRFFEPLANHFH